MDRGSEHAARSVRPALTVAGIVVVSLALVRLAWLPSVGPRELPAALTAASPERSLPLVLALAMAAFALWLAATVLLTLAADAPGAAGRLAARNAASAGPGGSPAHARR